MIRNEAVAELRDGISRAMADAGLDACQYALALNGEVVVTETLGSAPANARFVIFSATKPIVASLVWQLIGDGKLDPGLPIVTWWPEFGLNGKDVVTLEQVMVHTAGFPNAAVTGDGFFDADVRRAQMEAWSLESRPGTRYDYHGLSAHWVLAELIERMTGTDYTSALRERILDPLGLDRLELGVAPERQVDVQSLVHVGEPATLGEIQDLIRIPITELPSAAAAPAGGGDVVDKLLTPEMLAAGVPGGGAVSDAASLAMFYQHLLHDPKGLWDPALLHDVKTNVRNMFPDMIGRAAFRTLGLETAGDDDKADLRIGAGATSAGTFGHGGAGGQIAWADPATGLSFAFLTNTFDANVVRMYRRDARLTRLAAQAVAAS